MFFPDLIDLWGGVKEKYCCDCHLLSIFKVVVFFVFFVFFFSFGLDCLFVRLFSLLSYHNTVSHVNGILYNWA